MRTRGLRISLSFLVAALLLWLFSRQLDFWRVLGHIREANPFWLSAAVALQGLHVLLRCQRWRLLLTPMKPRIGFYNLFSTTSIGYMVSMILPFRLGEILRPMLLGQREGISKSGALASCVLERLMDALSVALLLGFYLIFLFEMPAAGTGNLNMAQVRAGGLLFGLGTLAIFPALYLVVHYRHQIFHYLDRRSGGGNALLPRVLHAFLGGFDVVKGGWIFTLAWIQSIAIWLFITGSIWVSLKAFGVGLGFGDSLLMMALLTLGIAVPTPGGVGPYEYAGKLGLVDFFGVEPNRAAATILVTHAFAIGPVIVIGILLLWKEGLTLKSLSRISREAQVATGDAGAPS